MLKISPGDEEFLRVADYLEHECKKSKVEILKGVSFAIQQEISDIDVIVYAGGALPKKFEWEHTHKILTPEDIIEKGLFPSGKVSLGKRGWAFRCYIPFEC
ncbi:MAG: hypothetical protein RMJ39_10145 [Deltaproteobacteria bacterium]|nr:hypothetical protein [Deltaproteobacteria bacterium]